MVDKVLLKKKMRAAGIRNQTELAKLLGITRNTLSKKINGPSEFKASEIQVLKDAMRLSDAETHCIFFQETLRLKETVRVSVGPGSLDDRNLYEDDGR